jgi:hypothetical protein
MCPSIADWIASNILCWHCNRCRCPEEHGKIISLETPSEHKSEDGENRNQRQFLDRGVHFVPLPKPRRMLRPISRIIETWRWHYNEVRPHSSLDYHTPNEFVARLPNAASRDATGQGAAVCGPPRPGPLQHPLRKGHMQQAKELVSS